MIRHMHAVGELSLPGQGAPQLVALGLALVLCSLIGLERQLRHKSAGLRTHALVGLGSALFVLVPQLGGMDIADVSRVIQGLVAGVGFLGAGAILKSQADENVQGLTTAASVWMTAAIGLACGLGRESTAVISALLALAVLSLVPLVVERSTGKPVRKD